MKSSIGRTVDVPFSWREDRNVYRVYLHISGVHDHHADLHQMVRDTDGVWRSTVSVPDDLCAFYWIMPVTAETVSDLESPGVDSHRRWLGLVKFTVTAGDFPESLGHSTAEADHISGPARHFQPADISTVRRPQGWVPRASGRIRMANAAPEPGWVHTDEPDWEQAVIDGGEDREDRTVWFSRSESADQLLILFDGEQWREVALPTALRRIRVNGKISSYNIVALDTSSDRAATLGRSPDFAWEVVDHVIPWAREQLSHDVELTPDRITVAGQSLGGLAALDTVMRYPDRLNRALVNSGSFWFPSWGDRVGGSIADDLECMSVTRSLREHGVKVHFDVGLGEGRGGTESGTVVGTEPADMVDHTRVVEKMLREAGVSTSLDISNHSHEIAGWAGALTRGLIMLNERRCCK